jgi:hypothetical protein
MTIVRFDFDKDKDLWNNWQNCNDKCKWSNFSKGIPKKMRGIAKGKKFEHCNKQLEEYLKDIHKSGFIEIFANSISKSWAKIEDVFFKRLKKITKKSFQRKSITAYITTSGRCPYDPEEGWFMVSFFSSLTGALRTVGHEIMHLHFHDNYWNNVEKEIGKQKTADLKEALTILLNIEFIDLWWDLDKGYGAHQELRKFIVKEWTKNKDFDVLLEKCINYLNSS